MAELQSIMNFEPLKLGVGGNFFVFGGAECDVRPF